MRNMGENNLLFHENLFTSYYRPLVGFVRKYVIDRHVSEDIVQDLFMDIWHKRNEIDFESRPIAPYLYKAAYNRCLNHIQTNKKRVTLNENISVDQLLEIKILEHNPLDTLMMKDAEVEIKRCIANLPNRCREVFVLSRHQHKKNKEIAQLLNISEKAVEKHITTAISRIKDHLYEVNLLP